MLQILSLNDQFRIRFRREAEVLQRLQHDSIVPILDYGEFDEVPYIVMPFMSVGTLSDRLATGPLKPNEGAQIFSQIASALYFAHENGVIHRDVKPSNILLDNNGNALLSDFGFAHIHDASLNLTGSALIGTPAYMSPEQIKGESITAKADQYALGVILFELSTGILPYEGETPMAVAIKHATDPLPAPSSVNANLPTEVEKVILRALDKDPDKRFETISAFNLAFLESLNASVDLQAGRLKPNAFHPIRTTLVLDSTELETEAQDERKRKRSLLLLPAMLLFLLGCPIAYWGYTLFYIPGAAAGGGQMSIVPVGIEEVTLAVVDSQPGDPLSTEDASIAITESPTGELGSSTTTPTLSGTALDSASITPSTVSSTPNGSPTVSITALSASPTPSRTATSTQTPTLVPSETPTPTTPPTSSPTIAIPTVILLPSKTPTVGMTIMPIDCTSVRINSFDPHDKDVRWDVTNLTPDAITLQIFLLDWPSVNDELKKVRLDDDTIWEGEDDTPPTVISGGWKGNVGDRTLLPGELKELRVDFDRSVLDSGYDLQLTFDNGCVVSTKD
jgi:serine/threonine-protein kinase